MTEETKPWQWQEGDYTVTRTTRWSGPGCHNGCGVLYYTKDNKLVKVEGDKDNPLFNGRLCPRCLNLTEAVHHPDRLKFPLKRVGKRGEDKWERISWDDAYDLFENKVRQIHKEFGPETIVGLGGTGRNIFSIVPKFTFSVLGSPNFIPGFLSGTSCYFPRAALMALTHGDFLIADCAQMYPERYDSQNYKIPECILIWGNNPLVANSDGFIGHWITDLMKRGTKIIVVDPRLTWLASRAEIHLPLRPGTDGALALGMLNVIINEELYDKEFVELWTFGFDKLKERVQEYPPERVEEITWVPKEKIIAAARFFAKSNPASIQWGVAVDMATHGVPAAHAISCLWAITGNVDVPGGEILVRPAYGAPIAMAFSNWGLFDMPEELMDKRIGYDYPLFRAVGESQCDELYKCLETEKPYKIQMLWIQGTNPIANTGAEAKRVYEAMKKVPFIVGADLFMTPTLMAFADLILPAATSPECDSLRSWWTPLRAMTKVIEVEEAKPDVQIMLDLGKRLNPTAFPYDNVRELLTDLIKPTGMTFEELENHGPLYPEFTYKKYEKGLLRDDGQPGFSTPSGRIELYSNVFEMWGYDPLPYYKEPYESPISTPDLYEEYPLVLTTGGRSWVFFHSENRQQPSAREIHPFPITQIHPDTAKRYGIEDGDWIWIENRHGKCRQKAEVTLGIDPRVVHAEHGWWYPEKSGAEPSLFGVWESNINLLTTACQAGPTGTGAPYKNQLCKIYKSEEGI